MYTAFFALAAVSPTRQQAFRWTMIVHLGLILMVCWLIAVPDPSPSVPYLGQVLLVAGIVEGAILIGWRLTQMPKSLGLEFLLVTRLEPPRVFIGEALVGLSRLALITLSGLPILVLLVAVGVIDPIGLALLVLMPFTWGAVIGLGLCVWAYETEGIRRWGERVMLGGILLWLAVGVLAGEHLRDWLTGLPASWQVFILGGFRTFVEHNPFAELTLWLRRDPWQTWHGTMWLQGGAMVVIVLCFVRAAWRLKGHFHDRHYKPIAARDHKKRPEVGDSPLSWWAVKRVTQYSGRINLWLAGGVGVLYAIYIVLGDHWPAWLGREVFTLFDRWGGVPMLTASLVLLAAVPAAYQYGLWDSSATERCKRLELLLLTELTSRDYWKAAWSAAWRRGRGYFVVALLLWTAALVAGKLSLSQTLMAVSLGLMLWLLYFALGFRAFSKGVQANGLGMLLTIGLPLLAFALGRMGWSGVAAMLPPGAVFHASGSLAPWMLLPGAVVASGLTLVVARVSLRECDRDLRLWYDKHHGRKVMD
jgi:hypothetical protein